jgi:hypothetical protein
MKQTKADGKKSSVKHRTDPPNSQIKLELGITLFPNNELTHTNIKAEHNHEIH